MAIMKEMETKNGFLKVKGEIFYVSQEPWIFNGTFMQNILFGREYEEQKFNLVIKSCCLDKVKTKTRP